MHTVNYFGGSDIPLKIHFGNHLNNSSAHQAIKRTKLCRLDNWPIWSEFKQCAIILVPVNTFENTVYHNASFCLHPSVLKWYHRFIDGIPSPNRSQVIHIFTLDMNMYPGTWGFKFCFKMQDISIRIDLYDKRDWLSSTHAMKITISPIRDSAIIGLKECMYRSGCRKDVKALIL